MRTKIYLFARAAGRCEFDDCGEYLLEHYPTFTPGNFAEMAHIWAFSPDGPRGNAGLEEGEDLNGFANLMLLCKSCHELVDGRPDVYTVDVLRSFKRAHEDAVFERTGLKRDQNTVALKMVAKIGVQEVVVSDAQMQAAVKPRYLSPRAVHSIDLATIPEQATPEYWEVAGSVVREGAKRLFETTFDGQPATHISVFALAPMPLLILLGSCLSNKVSTNLFQRHRDREDAPWVWKDDGPLAVFVCRVLQHGTQRDHVAMIVSLSGRVHRSRLPEAIDDRFTVYELALTSEEPGTGFLRTTRDLEEFRDTYRKAMRVIKADHEGLKEIHLFPAVPAPAAVSLGRDLLPKVDPVLVVYDDNKRVGGFVRTLEVNKG